MATVLTPQQPELRPFIIYDAVPEGFTAYLITDRYNEPFLRPGEWVIVDPTDCEPIHGEIALVQWKSGGEPKAYITKWIHQLQCWGVVGARPAFIVEQARVRHLDGGCIGDVGYRTEYMREVIKGRVVGILQAASAEPLRHIGRAA